MAFPTLTDFIFKFINQPDKILNDAANLKANMDSQTKAIRDFLVTGAGKAYLDTLIPTKGGITSISAGAASARPAFGTADAVYIATDTGVISKDIGSAWEAVLDLPTHVSNTTTAHGAVSAATASKIIIRDASGRAAVVGAGASTDITIMSDVTGNVEDTPVVGHTTKAASGNAVAVDIAALATHLANIVTAHAPENVNAPTLINSWVNSGGGFSPAQYWKDTMGIVHLKGNIKSGTLATIAFVLPLGYRPTYAMNFPTVSNGAFSHITIDGGGSVSIGSGLAAAGIFLDGVNFRAGV